MGQRPRAVGSSVPALAAALALAPTLAFPPATAPAFAASAALAALAAGGDVQVDLPPRRRGIKLHRRLLRSRYRLLPRRSARLEWVANNSGSDAGHHGRDRPELHHIARQHLQLSGSGDDWGHLLLRRRIRDVRQSRGWNVRQVLSVLLTRSGSPAARAAAAVSSTSCEMATACEATACEEVGATSQVSPAC